MLMARRFFLAALALTLFQPLAAWSYIDPNAGGLLFQLLMPLFTAAMGVWIFLRRSIASAVRRLWRRLRGGNQPG